MPLKRFIHAEMFTSEDFNFLSLQARLLWIGMFGCVADDEGRGKAGPGYLKASVFPADPFRLDQVSSWLAEIAERGMITLYQDQDERSLFQIPSWGAWQRPKYVKPSKFPGLNDKANSGQCGANDDQVKDEGSICTNSAYAEPENSTVGPKSNETNDKANSGQNGPNPATGRVGLGRVGLGSTPLPPQAGEQENPPGNRREQLTNPRARGESPRQLRRRTHDEFGHLRWCDHQAIGANPAPAECVICQAKATEAVL